MQKQKSTLVIHPSDPSTDCLKAIYENRDWTVIRDFDASPEYIAGQIGKHDRVVLLGHGTSEGLMAGSMVPLPSGEEVFFQFTHYIVSKSEAPLLKGKETISIWCHSDAFFRKYQAGTGLHTGMIISEVGEELYCLDDAVLDEEEMAENMELFCGTFAKYIDLPPQEMKKKVLDEYVGDDEVTRFNRERIIVL